MEFFCLSVLVLLVISALAITGCLDEEQKYPNAELDIVAAEARDMGTPHKPNPIGGYEFLWIGVHMENLNEKEDLALHAWFFELVTEQGGVFKNARMHEAPTKLIAGANYTFWVVFEIPREEIGVTLRFEPSWFLEEPFIGDIPSYK